jgi:hypothetical protein
MSKQHLLPTQDSSAFVSPGARSRLSQAIRGLLALAAIMIVAGILINLGDAALAPETQALMSVPKYAVEPERNGYFVLRAMDAALGSDVLKTGRILEDKYEKLYQENPRRSDYETQISYVKAPQSTWKADRCGPVTQNCVEADLHNRAEVESLLAQNVLALRRYELLQQLPEFEEHAIPSIFVPLLKYVPLVQGSDMSLAKASFDIADGRLKDGVDQLIKNDVALRRLLRKTSTLLSRSVALAMIARQARTISELVEIKPELLALYGEAVTYLVRPLRPEEISLSTVYASEARFAINHMNNVDAAHGIAIIVAESETPGAAARFAGKIFGLFFQPHATLNMIGASWRSIIDEANQAASEYDKVRTRLIEKNRHLAGNPYLPYLHYLSNPVGKMVWKIGADPIRYLDSMERSADIDGYLRLVGLQVDLRRRKIAENSIQAYADKAGADFRSPYDGKAMRWIAGKKQLQFFGRQISNANPDSGSVYVVQMR